MMAPISWILGPWLAVMPPPSPSTIEPDPPEPAPRARVVTHFATGPWLAEPTSHEPGRVAPGLATELELGVQRGSWLWFGAIGDYALFPARDFSAHQLTAGAFAGIRPRVGRLWLFYRVGVSAGSVYGRSSIDVVGRPLLVAQTRVGLERAATNAERVRFGFSVGLDFSSRQTSFATSTGDAIGLGHVRGGVMVSVAWDFAGG